MIGKGGASRSSRRLPGPMLLYRALRRRFGFLDWWPGETKIEILAGAILTQQTSWRNVEKALANLKGRGALSLERMARMRLNELEGLVRPSGFYRQKARRLRDTCNYILRNYGSLDGFFSLGKDELRRELLGLNGIGEETADSIMLYSAGKPVFVIDWYTRRALGRIAGFDGSRVAYGELQSYFEKNMEKEAELYKDAHAQFVELGKNYCRAKPLCRDCPLNNLCLYSKKREKQGGDAEQRASIRQAL